MPAGDVWGNSWGNSWDSHWKQAAVASQPARGTAAWLWPYADERRSREDIRRARERFGISDEAAEVIAAVAARQAEQALREQAEADEQKRFDELMHELQLKALEFDGRYLEALTAMRDVELRRRAEQQRLEEKDVILLMLMAAAAA